MEVEVAGTGGDVVDDVVVARGGIEVLAVGGFEGAGHVDEEGGRAMFIALRQGKLVAGE